MQRQGTAFKCIHSANRKRLTEKRIYVKQQVDLKPTNVEHETHVRKHHELYLVVLYRVHNRKAYRTYTCRRRRLKVNAGSATQPRNLSKECDTDASIKIIQKSLKSVISAITGNVVTRRCGERRFQNALITSRPGEYPWTGRYDLDFAEIRTRQEECSQEECSRFSYNPRFGQYNAFRCASRTDASLHRTPAPFHRTHR